MTTPSGSADFMRCSLYSLPRCLDDNPRRKDGSSASHQASIERDFDSPSTNGAIEARTYRQMLSLARR
ncbi:hypothetical protein AKJ09_03012 [Labilithrix luteola]|uniref:Uncharacterized protein n=1 Tax=Labilithrix luteola TaxID=1391654 RepID=A0A0K1PS41_9BACT|nr:hypothetical protein AKJ09_03012 [Labilithrix luteola]